jgi:hypothetical protein
MKKADQILEIIELQAEDFKSKNDSVITPSFFGDELLSKVSKDFYELEKIFLKNLSWGGQTSNENFRTLFEGAIRIFKSRNTITIPQSLALEKTKQLWLNDQRIDELKWNDEHYSFSYRNRYFKYLKNQGRSEKVLSETKRSSLSIVKKFGDPKSPGPFFVKGMVVGSVQSGKTANFNGVINSAVDTGYQFIIVLSGIMEDLRNQTQKRIEKDVIGPWQGGNTWLGVGAITAFKVQPDSGSPNIPVLKSITSPETDFNRNLMNAAIDLNNYNIMVCKKNVSVLSNILIWLKGYTSETNPTINIPFLLIDDEADNASLNNNGINPDLDPTKINLVIRAILNLFSKKTYLGYTATPFANILHDRNDIGNKMYNYNQEEFGVSENLFPDDFIELLFPPSDYIGIKHFFATKYSEIKKLDPLIAPVVMEQELVDSESFPPRFNKADNTPTVSNDKRTTRAPKREDQYPINLPSSLKEAIRCYILTIAVRLNRRPILKETPSYQPHHSMLIHISRFSVWQNKTKELVSNYVRDLTIGLSQNYGSLIYQEFEQTWNKHYLFINNNIKSYLEENKIEDPYLLPINFNPEIRNYLVEAVKGIEVKAVNSTKQNNNQQDNLFYPSIGERNFVEKKYIAIGGNRLSRGFTLEGLTVNYFIRGTDAADTLMQMGRWFGYRLGYLDCCKLFTTQSSIDKFDEASLIIEDLEIKFDQLSKMTDPPRTPSDFTLWIRNNPDIIKLTRGNFLRYLERKKVDFSSVIEQSTRFRINQNEILNSIQSFKEHFNNIQNWQAQDTYKGFISYETNQNGMLAITKLKNTWDNLNLLGLDEFLENCKAANKVTRWVIAIKASGEGRELKKEISGLPYDIKMTIRSGPGNSKGNNNDRAELLKNNIFKARNATIINASDFSILLSDDERKKVVSKFRQERKEKLIAEGLSSNEADTKSTMSSIPDYAYREAMDENTGLLILYFMDLNAVFKSDQNDTEMLQYETKLGLSDKTIPIIGCAIGFPSVRGVKPVYEVARNVFKEPKDMTIDELLDFAKKIGVDIEDDIISQREGILKKIMNVQDQSNIEKSIDDMNIEELKLYINNNDLPIDSDVITNIITLRDEIRKVLNED